MRPVLTKVIFAKMRLPPQLLQSQYFTFSSAEKVIEALGLEQDSDQAVRIQALAMRGVPPVISSDALAVMLGFNPGLIWSFANRKNKHYREFAIKSGKKTRTILAPRVGLKIVQKWLSVHLENIYDAPNHVFGFIAGRSHIDAAFVHRDAKWVYSCDIKDFFPSIAEDLVRSVLRAGCGDDGAADVISGVATLDGCLPQGSPLSPLISNLVFLDTDRALAEIGRDLDVCITRYADDVVVSSATARDDIAEIVSNVKGTLLKFGWVIADNKEYLAKHPQRRKVHGILVGDGSLRLTKGYRNKIRAYEHIRSKLNPETIKNYSIIRGHLDWSDHFEKRLAYLESRASH